MAQCPSPEDAAAQQAVGFRVQGFRVFGLGLFFWYGVEGLGSRSHTLGSLVEKAAFLIQRLSPIIKRSYPACYVVGFGDCR